MEQSLNSSVSLNDIRIVLIHTTHPGNIGATARAMKNMGLSQLYLVAPKIFPDKNATERAAGADDILDNAVVVSDLEEALVGTRLVIGSSARVRSIPWPMQNPRQAAEQVVSVLPQGPVAILFGREKAGLKNKELERCHSHIYIPTNPEFSSLNLAAAVQVICYEMRMAVAGGVPFKQPEPLAPAEEIANFYTHLEETLIENDFLHPTHPKKIMTRLRRMFARIELEMTEVNLLRGILTAFQKNRQ